LIEFQNKYLTFERGGARLERQGALPAFYDLISIQVHTVAAAAV